jgi:hypothetical protein
MAHGGPSSLPPFNKPIGSCRDLFILSSSWTALFPLAQKNKALLKGALQMLAHTPCTRSSVSIPSFQPQTKFQNSVAPSSLVFTFAGYKTSWPASEWQRGPTRSPKPSTWQSATSSPTGELNFVEFKRDKRTGPGCTLPFKLALPQLATTFVKYAAGRDATSAIVLHSRATGANAMVRRIETNPARSLSSTSTEQRLGDSESDLVVRAINHNQAASALCLGCQQPGHTLADCHRFVDYIVAESLAQSNPQLKAQIAASHQQFRSHLTAHARDGGCSDTVCSLQLDTSTQETVTSSLGTIYAPVVSPALSTSATSPAGF